MSRTLTSAAAAQAAATSATPISILKIEFGGSIGTKYYSDRTLGSGDASSALNAAARVIAWGHVDQSYREGVPSLVDDCRLVLHDADKTLKGYCDAVDLQRKKATIYQHFSGLTENDLQPVLVGVIAAPDVWSEANATITLHLTDVSMLHLRDIGTILKCDDLPFFARGDEGLTAPLAFGRVRRSVAIPLCDGAITELAKPCLEDSTHLFVMDAERFPQNTPITIRIDGEIIQGSFHGNAFHVTRRGADIVASGHTTAPRDAFSFYDSSLTGPDATYQGYILEVTDPAGNVHQREICAYSGAEKCVTYWPDITYASGGAMVSWTIPAGTSYKITSWKNAHDSGEKVYYGGTNYVYLVNDAPSKKVRYVEGLGEWAHQARVSDGGSQSRATVEFGPATHGYSRLNNALYSVNCCDTSVFGPSHPVTTITFGRHPTEFLKLLEEIRVTLDGVESAGDGTGTLLEDPSDVIQCILARFANVPSGDIDTASFDQAKSDGSSQLRFAFTLTEVRTSLRLAADLAFQARCALLWEDGKVRLQFIRNKLGSSAATLDTSVIAEDSLELSHAPLAEVVSEVIGRYSDLGEAQAVVARDGTVESAFGRRVKEIDLWAYNRKKYASSIASFWLERFKLLRERVRVKTYLPALALQRRDVVALDWPAFFSQGQKARILEIDHAPGRGEPPQLDAIGLTLELPRVAGCTHTCEAACETSAETGCFTLCETHAESCWQCETSCEEVCELCCVTISEIECVSFDTGCSGSCQTSCQAFLQTSSCQTSGCETACQTACQTHCESGCQTHCESACQTRCETGCQTHCETGCETSCQAGIECANTGSDDFTHADGTFDTSKWNHYHLVDQLHAQYKSNACWFSRRSSSPPDYASTIYNYYYRKCCSTDHRAYMSVGQGLLSGYDFVGVRARVPAADSLAGYLAAVHWSGPPDDGDGSASLYAQTTLGGLTLIANEYLGTYPSSIGVQAQGSAISLIVDGNKVRTVTDQTHQSGQFAGMEFEVQAGPWNDGVYCDNWNFTNVMI